MKIEEYQFLAMRTSPEGHDRVLNGCLGLIGESGEIVDVVKKWKFQSGENAELPRDKLIDECGDVLWYCAELCKGLNSSLAEVVDEFGRYQVQAKSISDLAYFLSLVCGVPYGMLCLEDNLDADGHFHNSRILDCLYYIGKIVAFTSKILSGICSSSLEEAMDRNIEKLKKRYPDGFDPERSIHRPEYEREEQIESTPIFLFEARNKTI